MAIEETKCTENYFIPRGPVGPRGDTGAIGPQGDSGPGTIGPIGPAGGSKIDINFQIGNTPYILLTPEKEYVPLGHFIFPGTTSFNPQTWRMAIATKALFQGNSINMRLVFIQADGTRIIVASMNKAVTQDPSATSVLYEILETDSFTGLPTAPANFVVEARALKADDFSAGFGGTHVTVFYATELRE